MVPYSPPLPPLLEAVVTIVQPSTVSDVYYYPVPQPPTPPVVRSSQELMTGPRLRLHRAGEEKYLRQKRRKAKRERWRQ